jgi:hypothetical protein
MPESCPKAVCSVTEVARSLELSRARFYQLVQEGVFPTPVYDIRSRRPYYTVELQQRCHQVRQTNIGQNGLPILFYSPRHKNDTLTGKTTKLVKKRKETPATDSIVRELTNALANLGIRDISEEQVADVLNKLYPDNQFQTMDHGVILRGLFRHFRQEKTK